jgi:c-di-AMP phosphodiesterase-like protein
MDIGNALRRAGREDITIRAVLANTISEVYQREVLIESVKIHGSTILIKTGKPLINSELSLLSEDIKKASLQKLDDM